MPFPCVVARRKKFVKSHEIRFCRRLATAGAYTDACRPGRSLTMRRRCAGAGLSSISFGFQRTAAHFPEVFQRSGRQGVRYGRWPLLPPLPAGCPAPAQAGGCRCRFAPPAIPVLDVRIFPSLWRVRSRGPSSDHSGRRATGETRQKGSPYGGSGRRRPLLTERPASLAVAVAMSLSMPRPGPESTPAGGCPAATLSVSLAMPSFSRRAGLALPLPAVTMPVAMLLFSFAVRMPLRSAATTVRLRPQSFLSSHLRFHKHLLLKYISLYGS